MARVFMNMLNFRLLTHFMRPDGATASGLARAHGLALNAAYRKVKWMDGLGLLRVLREEERPGRATRVYGCTARTFFVPSTPMSLEGWLVDNFGVCQELMTDAFIRHAEAPPNPVGVMLIVAERGQLWMLPATPDGERWTPRLAPPPALLHTLLTPVGSDHGLAMPHAGYTEHV